MNQSVEKILEQRGSRYGSFEDHADITISLMNAFIAHYQITHENTNLPSYMEESIHMIFHKLGRIANGNPYYDDSWIDIAGYAQLVVYILREKAKQNNSLLIGGS